ncbi:Serine/threonine-protein kinase AFC2 [Apostasia shenzhenica]|uniref:Serine/threonine-protein kinase AFC2 n=1 Tax=Apostasia shenzhenica TaxID=1088818 RepID=A0A2I0B4Q8_9ASPA|nr:Serine/threonine-protein kinase AFC2 [Apostasia shenzhenica]
MADSVDVVLDFLRKNRFTKAEAALRGELTSRPDLNGVLPKYYSEEEVKMESRTAAVKQQGEVAHTVDISQEFIIKEIEVGNGANSKKNLRKKQDHGNESGSSDLYPWNFTHVDGNAISFSKDNSLLNTNLSDLVISEERRFQQGPQLSNKKNSSMGNKLELQGEQSASYRGVSVELNPGINQACDSKAGCSHPKDHFLENPWSKSDIAIKECSVKNVLPFTSENSSSGYDCAAGDGEDRKNRKKKTSQWDTVEGRKEQLLDSSRHHNSIMPQESDHLSFDIPLYGVSHREELPRLPPVRLKSEDRLSNLNWEENTEQHVVGATHNGSDNTFMIGSFLEVPIGQEINASGGKRIGGGNWLSVSQGIAEDTSDLVSGFATLGDDSIDYPNEYWDSDEYEDDDDVGFMRQPIEDETWFLAHEIDYPSDNEKGTGHESTPDHQERVVRKDEDDEQSFAEEDSYLSGDQYFRSKNIEQVAAKKGNMGLEISEMFGKSAENDLMAQYDGHLMDVEELKLMRAEPVWQGFVNQGNELIILENGKVLSECGRPRPGDLVVEDEHHGSVRSIGVGISSDAADIGSEVRESLVGGSSEGDIDYFCDHDTGRSGTTHSRYDVGTSYFLPSMMDKPKKSKQNSDKHILTSSNNNALTGVNLVDGGFSFPPPLRKDGAIRVNSGNSPWSSKGNDNVGATTDDYGNGIGTEDMLASWKRKSNASSPVKSSRDEKNTDVVRSRNSSASSASNFGYSEKELFGKIDGKEKDAGGEEPGITLEDEEAAALQEQVRQIKHQEEEFETFNLKIVHRKNRTGFEEDKNFHVVLNSVIAGRYHVTEYLGSAAFSKAIQAHDLHTGMDVCVKIIKNNKDFFDQSLDEIKLLKFVNKHDPADKYHILRLYDYFYYREHLLIVCELLKANLYEFHKFNRESGGEVYFTMPRLQSITIQCLEALQFLHGLGLIHCDLKPENILVKSYSRCEVKVIDLGSSCFETDHLCSYVQSRSYRAPEVLFQNDSPATLLARVVGIIGSIDQTMLAKGRDTYKYFTKNHMLYERNQETNRLDYLIPKKTSLRHRLPMGDQGFIDFVAYLLEINPKRRPNASEALKHPWLSYPYEPISS